MSAAPVPVITEFILKRDRYLADLRATIGETRSEIDKLAEMPIEISVKMDDQITVQLEELIQSFRSEAIKIPAIIIDAMSAQIELIREREEATAITVPVVAVPTGGAAAGVAGLLPGAAGEEAAAGAAAAGGAAGAAEEAEAGGGFLSGLMSRRGIISAMIAIHGLNQLANEISKGNQNDEINAMEDPMEQLRKRRELIESEHTGLRGGANYLYGKLGLEPTYDEEISQLNESEKQMRATDRRQRQVEAGTRNRKSIDAQAEDQDFDASHITDNDFAKRQAQLDRALKKHDDAADKILEGWQQYGFGAYKDAEAFVDKLKGNSRKIHDAAEKELQKAEQEHIADLSATAQQLSLRSSGQTREADRQELERRIAKQQEEEDKKGADAGRTFRENVAPQMRTQFDQQNDRREAAQKFESDQRLAAIDESQIEATLRGQHTRRGDQEASMRAEVFAIDQRVAKAKELADLETDIVKKKQLQAEADKLATAAVTEKAAIQERYNRELDSTKSQSLSPAEYYFAIQKSILEAQDKLNLPTPPNAPGKSGSASGAPLAGGSSVAATATPGEFDGFAGMRREFGGKAVPESSLNTYRKELAEAQENARLAGGGEWMGHSGSVWQQKQKNVTDALAEAQAYNRQLQNESGTAKPWWLGPVEGHWGNSSMDAIRGATTKPSIDDAFGTAPKDLKDGATKLGDASDKFQKAVDKLSDIAIVAYT